MRKLLSVENPAIAAEWDCEMNAGIYPDDYTGGSEKMVWWRCAKCGHRWEAKIYSRTEGRGCPKCGRKRVKLGVNDLATLSPALAAEWDVAANFPLCPTDVTGGANDNVWWLCKLGHSWQNSVNHRFYGGQNCPYCGNKKVLAGFNDLATTHPRIAKEWHREHNGKLRPSQFTAGADVKVWWKCRSCGYSWEARIYTRKKHGCPCCAGNIFIPGVNDLQTVNRAVANQWHPIKNKGLTSDCVATNRNRKAWWICSEGHVWEALISSRNQGRGCPYCENRAVLAGFNDLATLRPEIAEQWHHPRIRGLEPHQVTAYSHRKVFWKCSCGHIWKASIANRSNGTNCPLCANKVVIAGKNDLKTIRPDIAEQWDDKSNGLLTPANVTIGSNRKVKWVCERGHSFDATVVARTHGSQCPYCVGKRPIIGETDFATVHPELLDEWDYGRNKKFGPQDITAASHKAPWWHCAEGHRWKTAAYNRHAGSGCPVCAKLKDKHIVTVGINDLMTVHPSIAKQWDYGVNHELTPQQVLSQSNREVGWVCGFGHRWLATVQSRTLGRDCPYCYGRTPLRTRLI